MKKFLSILLFSFAIPQMAIAETVIAEGYGFDSFTASLSAKRNAIAKVSGEYVESKEVLDYDRTTKQLISVTYGIVKNTETIQPYDENTRKIVIKYEIDKNADFFKNKEKKEALFMTKNAVIEAANAQDEREKSIKELYKDLNAIYKVNVDKVTILPRIHDKIVYRIAFSVETRDEWIEKKNQLEKILGSFTHITENKTFCRVSSLDLRFIDDENGVREKVYGLKNKEGKGFVLGAKDVYYGEMIIRNEKAIEQFNFRIILFKTKNYGYCQYATYE